MIYWKGGLKGSATFLFFSLWLLVASTGAAGIITTVVGNGSYPYPGDGYLATSVAIAIPFGAAFDASGNMYITAGGNRVLKVDAATQLVTSVAGIATTGFSGDGGLATSAQLYSPHAVHVDSSGNIFIADSFNCRIRLVNPLGIISTFWGDGDFDTVSGIGDILYDASGNLFIADIGNSRVLLVPPTGGTQIFAGGSTLPGYLNGGYSGDGGPATSALLRNPYGLAVDSAGNLYIADSQNHVVRKVDIRSRIITTVAGTGVSGYSGDNGDATLAQLWGPAGLDTDGADNLYIADESNYRIRKIDLKTGVITTVAGTGVYGFSGDGGPAENAMVVAKDVRVDSSGNLYISDSGNMRVRRVAADITGHMVTPSTAGSGSIFPDTPQTVNHGETTTFTVTPMDGFTATVGGTCGGSLIGSEYTSDPIIAACTIDAVFTLMGDLDQNGSVDLTDAILALQVIVGISPSTPVFSTADINNDGRLGLEEAIKAIQAASGDI